MRVLGWINCFKDIRQLISSPVLGDSLGYRQFGESRNKKCDSFLFQDCSGCGVGV